MTYPDDVLKAAREAAAKYWGELHLAEPDAGWGGFADCALKGEFDGDAEVQAACIAIMAEREKCAEMEAKLASADLERRADDFMFSQLVGGQTKPRSYRAIFRRALKGKFS